MTHTHSYWKRLRIVARFSYVKSQRTIHIAIRSRKFRKAFFSSCIGFSVLLCHFGDLIRFFNLHNALIYS